MRIREIIKMRTANDGTRTLFESVLVPELVSALQDWAKAQVDCVLIGGLALSYYIRPRTTQDIDFLFLNDASIPAEVEGFKRTRPHAFQHNATHVEIELVTPELVKIPRKVVEHIVQTAVVSDNIKVASASGLTASKLFRLSAQDRADIIALVKTGRIDLTGFPMPRIKLKAFAVLAKEARTDPHP